MTENLVKPNNRPAMPHRQNKYSSRCGLNIEHKPLRPGDKTCGISVQAYNNDGLSSISFSEWRMRYGR
jgi:hypothetical protein